MNYWTPAVKSLEEYNVNNASFSDKEKLQYSQLVGFFMNKKGIKSSIANNMAQMILFKRKYHDLRYSEEQEEQLRTALQPIHTNSILIHSVATSNPAL